MAKKTQPASDPEPTEHVRKVELVPKRDVETFYINSVNIDLSSFDVRFRMGLIQGATDTSVQVAELLNVFMSHSHFRAFITAVNETLRKLDSLEATAVGQTQTH